MFVRKNQSLVILLPLAIIAVFVVSALASFVSGYANQWVANKGSSTCAARVRGVLRLRGLLDEVATAQLVTLHLRRQHAAASASKC